VSFLSSRGVPFFAVKMLIACALESHSESE